MSNEREVNKLKRTLDTKELQELLLEVSQGKIDTNSAYEKILSSLRRAPFENLGFAKIDHHRDLRQGFPEVIFGIGKTPSQIASVAERIVKAGDNLLVTRTTLEVHSEVQKVVPTCHYHSEARAITLQQRQQQPGQGTIIVVTAGTSDIAVAEEAVVSAEIMGNRVERLYDVGVAGLHRLLQEHERLTTAKVIIVVAGMEGALPSVVGGLVQVPVIAVPTSVGYGANFSGLSALLGMLNSCATGVSVVNIDNGIGAAATASRINHL